jgi:hypothetical protein
MYFRFFLKIVDSLEWIPTVGMKQRAKQAFENAIGSSKTAASRHHFVNTDK